ncbi:MAG: hypothetical protein U0350_14860 [Caldilineaceae bacterium]
MPVPIINSSFPIVSGNDCSDKPKDLFSQPGLGCAYATRGFVAGVQERSTDWLSIQWPCRMCNDVW